MDTATGEIPAEANASTATASVGSRPAALLADADGELRAILGTWWQTLAHPSAATLEAHRSAANWEEIVLAAFATGAAAGLWLSRGAASQRLAPGPLWLWLLCLLASVIFLAALGGSYLAAKLLGGGGRFVEQAYLTSLSATPLALLALAAQALPLAGPAIAAGATAYALYHAVLALRIAHGLTATVLTGPALSWRYAYFLIGIVPAVAGFCALFVIYHLIVATLPPVR